jgi:hypothetical protein
MEVKMITVILNAKGETLCLSGATVLNYEAYVVSRGKVPGWGFTEIKWRPEVVRLKLPEGGVILPLDYPRSIVVELTKRLKSNPVKFMAEVGFLVEDSKDAKGEFIAHWNYEIGPAEKAYEKRMARKRIDGEVKGDTGMWMAPCHMMIPEIGTVLRLEEDWTFQLHSEYRNKKVIDLVGKEFKWDWTWEKEGRKAPGPWEVTIRKGALLTVDRLYVRKGADDYSSLTFILRQDGKPTLAFGGKEIECKGGFKHFGVSGVARFWAKLEDVNRMVVSGLVGTVK